MKTFQTTIVSLVIASIVSVRAEVFRARILSDNVQAPDQKSECLNANSASASDSADMRECSESLNELWSLNVKAFESTLIQSVSNASNCLTASVNGNSAGLSTCETGNPSQQWFYYGSGDNTTTFIQLTSTSTCLAQQDGFLILEGCHDSGNGEEALWSIVKA